MENEKISYQDIINDVEPELKKVVAFLMNELKKIRTERVSPDLVEDLKVDYFGKTYSLKELASISASQSRELIIKPWDKSYLGDILSALERSTIKVSSVIDNDVIRIKLPSLSEEFRNDLIRLVTQTQEQAKQTMRKWRDNGWASIKDAERDKKMSEDEKFKGKKKLEKMIKDFSAQIEKISESKIKELKN
jgi:ribosome recycling factor